MYSVRLIDDGNAETFQVPDTMRLTIGDDDNINMEQINDFLVASLQQSLHAEMEYPTVLSSMRAFCRGKMGFTFQLLFGENLLLEEQISRAPYQLTKLPNDIEITEQMKFYREVA